MSAGFAVRAKPCPERQSAGAPNTESLRKSRQSMGILRGVVLADQRSGSNPTGFCFRTVHYATLAIPVGWYSVTAPILPAATWLSPARCNAELSAVANSAVRQSTSLRRAFFV